MDEVNGVAEVPEAPVTVLAPVPTTPELTLRDLVLKLQTAPLAPPEALPLPSTLSPDPDKTQETKTQQTKTQEPMVSLIDKHATKFPLGGVEPEQLPGNGADKPKPTVAPETANENAKPTEANKP